MFAAPANDLVNCCTTPSLSRSCVELGSDEIVAAMADAYPAVNSAPKSDCIIAPPRSRCRSAVPEAIPALLTAGVWALWQWGAVLHPSDPVGALAVLLFAAGAGLLRRATLGPGTGRLAFPTHHTEV